MYKVTFQDNSTEEAYHVCYDKKGNPFGYVAYNNVFKSLENVKTIDQEVTVTERVWPPKELTPEKRPFKVGDRVKVVSLEAAKEAWPDIDFDKYDYGIRYEGTVTLLYPSENAVLVDCLKYATHIDDIIHVDQPQQDEFNVYDWVEVISLDNTKKHCDIFDDMKIGKTLQIRSFLKNGLINLSDHRTYHPFDLIHDPQSS